MTANTSIYALYSNGTFVSWLYGAFCQLVDEPKVYIYNGTDSQTKIVLKNITYKIAELNNSSEFGVPIIDVEQNAEKKELRGMSNFQLGVFHLHESAISKASLDEIRASQPNQLIDIAV